MPEKKSRPEKGVVEVTFELPSEVEGEQVQLVGDFTNWEGRPMKRQDDGSWRTTMELEPGRTYQFRYLIDGQRWENDWAADGYERNEFGAENSVIRTPHVDQVSSDPPEAQRAMDAAAAQPRGDRTSGAASGNSQATAPSRTAMKNAAKKSTTKKSAAKTSPAKKAAKSPAKKSAAKKTAAKSPAKKTAAKKTAAKKSTPPKSPAKKAAPGKTQPGAKKTPPGGSTPRGPASS